MIEKNIPIPDCLIMHGNAKNPWNELEVGDSFLINVKNHQSLKSSCSTANKKYKGKVFRGAKTEEGFRVWRTK